ncbi:hypothetical protein HON01_03410, partial [Candidatus Woesearchaeota archaeon]|nr:hypothetical protein [Candidatus Woesearchaeota archaeon]
ENPKYHGDVSTFAHSLGVVECLDHIYSFIFSQEKSEHIDVVALQSSLNLLPFKLDSHLEKKIGNHPRKELLFFACIFHDIGKLKNFTHLMKDVDKHQVKGVAKFLHHADFGSHYFDHEVEDLNELKLKLLHESEELDGDKKLSIEQKQVMSHFYESAIFYLDELLHEFSIRKEFFKKLELGHDERKYVAFLIKNHMKLIHLYQYYSDMLGAKSKSRNNMLNGCVRTIFEMSDEWGDKFIDCFMLNFSDLLESVHSSGKVTKPLYDFFKFCMLAYVHKAELLHDKGGMVVDDSGSRFEKVKTVSAEQLEAVKHFLEHEGIGAGFIKDESALTMSEKEFRGFVARQEIPRKLMGGVSKELNAHR